MSEWRPGVTVYLDAADIQAIDIIRADQYRTRSEWIRLAVKEALRLASIEEAAR